MSSHTEPTTRARDQARLAAHDPQLARWARLRDGGRSAFLWRNGVVGWGLPAAVVTALYKVVEVQGLAWPPTLSDELRPALVLIALVFPALGYLFGGWLWAQGEARFGARLDAAARGRAGPLRERRGAK